MYYIAKAKESENRYLKTERNEYGGIIFYFCKDFDKADKYETYEQAQEIRNKHNKDKKLVEFAGCELEIFLEHENSEPKEPTQTESILRLEKEVSDLQHALQAEKSRNEIQANALKNALATIERESNDLKKEREQLVKLLDELKDIRQKYIQTKQAYKILKGLFVEIVKK